MIIGFDNGEFTAGYRHGFLAHCSCKECLQQFRGYEQMQHKHFAYATYYPIGEAEEKADGLRQSIFEDQDYLKQQCLMNGNLILTRWNSMISEERKKLLLKVDPEMYPHDWSELRFHFKHKEFRVRHQREPSKFHISADLAERPHRYACLLPYINLEDLKNDPLRFLSLLYNRVKYSPAQWAPFDNFLLAEQWRIGAFDTSYNEGSIIIGDNEYGKYTAWTPKAAHEWTAIGFPRGILILDAQQHLMKLLCNIVENLVEGTVRGDDIHRGDNFTKTLQDGLRKENGPCVKFASVYLNQAFSAPPVFSIQALLSTAQTQVSSHAEHLRLLQTKPSYMCQHAASVVAGSLGENLTTTNKLVWAASHLMHDAIRFWSWEWILEEVQTLQKAQLKSGNLSRKNTFPKEYTRALTSLEALLMFLARLFASQIYRVLPHRPGFRSKWKATFTQDFQASAIQARQAENIQDGKLFNTNRLDFILSTLVVHCYNKVNFDTSVRNWHPRLFAILEEHLIELGRKGDKKEMDRFDKVLSTMYADLSALSQMITMIRFHQPYVPESSFEEVQNSETSRGWRYIRNKFTDQILA
jgi:hypothetical protein